jgi:hypothetical protein
MKYLRLSIISCLILLLTNCSYMSMIRGEVAKRGANTEDQVLESAEWARCSGVSIGAVRRVYDTPEKLSEYIKSCDKHFD